MIPYLKFCNFLEPGVRHSTRNRRLPDDKLFLAPILEKQTTNRSALQKTNRNTAPKRVRIFSNITIPH